LTQPISAWDPVSRNPVQQDSRKASEKDSLHPETPTLVKTTSSQDDEKVVPVDRVKGFTEVDIKNQGGRFAIVAAAKKIGRVNNVLGDTAPGQEPSLVSVNKGLNRGLESRSQHLGDGFNDTILQRDGTVLERMVSRFDFGEKDQKVTVDPGEIHRAIVEGAEEGEAVRSDRVPEGREEGRAEAVRAGAGQLIHAQEGIFYLLRGEGVTEVARQGRGIAIQGVNTKKPGCGDNRTEEIRVEALQDGSL
jgi:hypothetical protein